MKRLFMFSKSTSIKSKHWKNKDFLNEMNKRIKDFKEGKTETHCWEDIKSRLLSKLSSDIEK